MAFNLGNSAKVFLGTGTMNINGEDPGVLKGDVGLKIGIKQKSITGGSPERVIKKITEEETATISAKTLEFDLATLARMIPQFSFSNLASGSAAVVDEYAGFLYSDKWTPVTNPYWTDAAVTVRLASKTSGALVAGTTTVRVEKAALFAAGDTIRLRAGATTETATIAAGGVDAGTNTLTLTAGITNSYGVGALVVNTAQALAEGTDYRLDPIGGRVSRIAASTDLNEGDTAVASYTHHVFSAERLTVGGKTASFSYPALFVSDEDDEGKRYYVRFYKAQFSGDLSIDFKTGDALLVPIEIEALADSSRPEGDQLCSIERR